MKSSLIINTKPPHSSQATKEAQDATLAFAAFGIKLGVLFLDDGVFQLKKNQNTSLGQKHTAAVFESFPLYDITDVFVCSDDLSQRGMTEHDLVIESKLIARDQLPSLLQQFDNLLTF